MYICDHNYGGPLLLVNIFFKFWLFIDFDIQLINSLRPSDAYVRQYSKHHWFR